MAHSFLEPPLEYNQDQMPLKKIPDRKKNAFDKSRFITTFLTILGVTKILCSLKLVLEGKTGKEIPESSRLEFKEKFSANNFPLSDAESNTSGPLNSGCIISNSSEVTRAKYLGSNGVFCFISICKFGNFKNPLAMIIRLSEHYLRIRRFFSLVQTKKVISMTYGSSTSS